MLPCHCQVRVEVQVLNSASKDIQVVRGLLITEQVFLFPTKSLLTPPWWEGWKYLVTLSYEASTDIIGGRPG